MISGPTTAISIMVYSALSTKFAVGSTEYITAAIVLTFMVGLIQLALAFFRLGSLSNFISDSVMVGFTSGAAFVILIAQIPTVFGASISVVFLSPQIGQPSQYLIHFGLHRQ